MLISPARRFLSECRPFIYPFGCCITQNVMEGLDCSEPCEDNAKLKVIIMKNVKSYKIRIITLFHQVLFLNCGDLMSSLTSVAHGGLYFTKP